MKPHEPLSSNQLDWLEEVLLNRINDDTDTEGLDEGILDVPELDGFLTAIVSGPVVLVPSRWMPAMWGDFEPIWNGADEFQRFMSLLMQHSNSIAGMLMEAPEAFESIFYERKLEDRAVITVDEWCEGYMRGVRLAEKGMACRRTGNRGPARAHSRVHRRDELVRACAERRSGGRATSRLDCAERMRHSCEMAS